MQPSVEETCAPAELENSAEGSCPLRTQSTYNKNNNGRNKTIDDAVRVPVFLLPSLAGTRLRNWGPRHDCGILGQYYDVGGTVWLDIKRMLLQTKCWIRCLKLEPYTQGDYTDAEGGGCRARPDEGLDALTQVDETVPTGYLLKPLIHMLVAEMGYEPEQTIVAHPYDWRLPPRHLEDRDAAFSRLKHKIEGSVALFRRRHPTSPLRGVMLVAHSLGNMFLQYFFQYLKAELGEQGLEEWADKHVHSMIMGGAPFLGSPHAIKGVLVGDTMSIPLPYTEAQSRELHSSWGVFPWMFPSAPTIDTHNPRHAAMNHGELDHPVPVAEVKLVDGSSVQYKSHEAGQGFMMQLKDKLLHPIHHMQETWYQSDPLIGGVSPLEPWTPPKGIDHIICSYGVNVPTPVGYQFQQYDDGTYQVSDILLNDKGDIRSLNGDYVLPKGRRYFGRKSGDGTVPYYSLSWCHSWFGSGLVNITKYPANRKYETDDVENFLNVDVMNASQTAKMDENRTGHGYDSMYVQQWQEEHPESGLPRLKTIQVWEINGVIHKDAITDTRMTHLIQWTMNKMEEFRRALLEAGEQIFDTARNESSLSSLLNSNWMVEMAREGPLFSKEHPPTTDDDCYWDYYNVACAWPRYCSHQYKIGDLHLSQSCRLRETPLAKDDPELLLKSHIPLNETYNITDGISSTVEWRIVYRDRQDLFAPWVYVFAAFVSGGLAVIFLLYLVLHRYRKDLLRVIATRKTPPFLGPDGTPSPCSIAENEFICLGGRDQSVLIRGSDTKDNPILLMLHGGPGFSERAFWRYYNSAVLEKSYTVVYWDQRGSGKSFDPTISKEVEMTVEQFLSDLDELVDILCRRLKKSNVVLFGHSWGSALGPLYASRFPNKVAAYVGAGQLGDWAASERATYNYTLAEANRQSNRKAMQALQDIGPPPHNCDALCVQRNLLADLEGDLTFDTVWKMIKIYSSVPETSLMDFIQFWKILTFSIDAMWQEVTSLNLLELVPKLDMPTFFFLGKQDHCVPTEISMDFINHLKAPSKEVVWFEHSKHEPFVDEPDKFNQLMVEMVRPVAVVSN